LVKLRPVTYFRIDGPREHDGLADPVGTFHKPQAVRVKIAN